MSFKRVADDFDDFNLQRKRRVNDLLLDDIPSDEVVLTANGRLACMVCHHRPVFDTTAMLTIHRNGKKHVANALIKLERVKEDADIKQRREHEQYLKAHTEAPLLGLTNLHKEMALSSSSHLSVTLPLCTTRQSGGVFVQEHIPGKFGSHTSNPTTSKERFFKPKSNLNLLEMQGSKFKNKSLSATQGQDVSKQRFFKYKTNFQEQKGKNINNKTCSSTSNTYTVAQDTRNAHSQQNINFNITKSNRNYPGQNLKKTQYNHLGNMNESAKERFLSVNPLTQQKVQPQVSVASNYGENSSDVSQSTEEGTSDVVTPKELSEYEKLDQKARVVYVNKLRQLGWLMGLDGKWQKDEEADFDSDEDEPPSPKTLLQGS